MKNHIIIEVLKQEIYSMEQYLASYEQREVMSKEDLENQKGMSNVLTSYKQQLVFLQGN